MRPVPSTATTQTREVQSVDDSRGLPPPPPQGPSPDAPGTPSVWAPPDAAEAYDRRARQAPDTSGVDVEVERGGDGPPPPPFVRQRRRRRRNLLIAIVVVVVIGTPVALAIAGGLSFSDDPEAATDEGPSASPDEAPDDDPSNPEGPSGDVELEPLDLDRLDGLDAVYGRLFTDIDASEQAMMGFQDELTAAFQSQDPTDLDGLLDAVTDAAGRGRGALLDVRERLADGLDDDGAEAVRESYVAHLDSWADYMAAIEDDPAVLTSDDTDSSFTVHINATADGFARAVEEHLPDDIDGDVRRFADALLDRGFRGLGSADV